MIKFQKYDAKNTQKQNSNPFCWQLVFALGGIFEFWSQMHNWLAPNKNLNWNISWFQDRKWSISWKGVLQMKNSNQIIQRDTNDDMVWWIWRFLASKSLSIFFIYCRLYSICIVPFSCFFCNLTWYMILSFFSAMAEILQLALL